MTPEQEKHLERLMVEINRRFPAKYIAGAESHKNTDPILKKTPLQLCEDTILELIDALFYQLSQREVLLSEVKE